MADKKISQLTVATTPLAGTETLPIVQGGQTVKVSAQSVANLAPAELPSQTGNNGKYLTTNGTTASWGTVSGGFPTALISFQFTAPGVLSSTVEFNNTGSTFALTVLSAVGGNLRITSSLGIINSKTFITMNAFRDAFNFPAFTTAFLCQASVNNPNTSIIQLSNGDGANFDLTNAVTQNPVYMQIVFYP